MSEVQENIRRAQINKRVADLVAKPMNVEIMTLDAKTAKLEGQALTQKLVEMLTASPTVPLELDDFSLVGLFSSALERKAEKISFKTIEGGYQAFFYRRTPKWLRGVIPYYPWGGKKAYLATAHFEIDLSTCKVDQK